MYFFFCRQMPRILHKFAISGNFWSNSSYYNLWIFAKFCSFVSEGFWLHLTLKPSIVLETRYILPGGASKHFIEVVSRMFIPVGRRPACRISYKPMAKFVKWYPLSIFINVASNYLYLFFTGCDNSNSKCERAGDLQLGL